MRFIESNHRYKMWHAGFHYILEFRIRANSDRILYSKLHKVFTEMYGPVHKIEPTETFNRYIYNENWRVERNNSKKTQRIYLKDGSAYTMAQLRMS